MLGIGTRIDPVDLLSAAGTFLAAMAALISVYGLVFDELPPRLWEEFIASWWVLGVMLQTGAGWFGRLRLAWRAAA
jgi:Mg2+ and Co2+ transporter CorA